MAMFLGRTKTRTTHEFFPEGPHAITNLLINTPQRRRLAAVGNLFISHYKTRGISVRGECYDIVLIVK